MYAVQVEGKTRVMSRRPGHSKPSAPLEIHRQQYVVQVDRRGRYTRILSGLEASGSASANEHLGHLLRRGPLEA
jgi:hypothetical protein